MSHAEGVLKQSAHGGTGVTLRLRLILSIGFGLIASVAFGGTVAWWEAARQVRTEMRAAITGAERVAQTAVGDSSYGAPQHERLQRLIREFDGSRHIQAALVDRQHRTTLSSKLEVPATRVPEWFRFLLDTGPEVSRIDLPPEFDAYESVVLTTDSANELVEKWDDIGLALRVLVAFCTFVLGLVYWILARGLRPLQVLNSAFDRVGRGDYSARVSESGATELALLAREFNQMVARLSTMQVQNTRLNQQLATVQEEDRAELARELHDEIGPFLFSVGLDISAIQQAINRNENIAAQLASRLQAIRESVAHMQKHLKIILGRLRPTVLLDLGLAQAMDNLIDFWRERHPDVVFDLKMSPESFGERLDEGIYRIVRESLNNALRHGKPSEIDINIQLTADDAVAVSVVDDGGGMNPADAPPGFGITGMQERAALLGGTVSVQNRSDGQGVAVNVRLPRRAPSELCTGEAEGAIPA
jgi:two-component system, NarL family, sensor histidine kinase UhpB